MKNNLKYLISLFLALVVIAGDCALNYQSNSPEYYQSSNVIVSPELEFKSFRLYKFGFSKSIEKTSFAIFIIYKNVKEVLTLQIRILLQRCELLNQKINSFIKQSVFLNEIITSKHFPKSLYTA